MSIPAPDPVMESVVEVTHVSVIPCRSSRVVLRLAYLLPPPLRSLALTSRTLLPRLAQDYRVRTLFLASTLLLGILFLSIPEVPERLLGIRSPEHVIQAYQSEKVRALATNLSQAAPGQEHRKRRQVPHKFWARARPHNRFKRKKNNVNKNNKPENSPKG